MKRSMCSLFSAFAGIALAFALTSCGGDGYADDENVFQNPPPKKPAFGYQGHGTQYADGANHGANPDAVDPDASTTPADGNPVQATIPPATIPAENPSQPAVTPPVTAPAQPGPATNAATPTKPGGNLPYGIPVIGKKGFLYSPYAPEKGMVDVTDLASGVKVECPYTFKHFRVP
jgi:hypothetical protein